MKFRMIALAALAATGSAHAISPTDMANDANLKVIRIAGASAQTPLIGSYLYNNICNKTTFDHFVKGSDHHAYSCKLSKAVGSYAVGTPVLVTKRDKGGSLFGVNPIALGTAQETLDVLTSGSCTVISGATPNATTANYNCSLVASQVADAGISDVEPALFQVAVKVNGVTTYPNLEPGATVLTTSDLATLNVSTSNQTIFGVAVSKNLRDAMQSAQGLVVGSEQESQQPSMSPAFYAALAAGFIKGNTVATPPFTGWSAITGVAADDAKAVNLCRRVNGSGTQASSNMFFLNMGALTDTIKGAMVPMSAVGATSPTNAGSLNVIENSSTGNVESCLDTANTNAAYAAGVISLEKDPVVSNKAYRFVKLAGVTPNQVNARTGAYPFIFGASMQFKTGALPADVQSFVTSVRTNIGKPATIATLSTPARNGVLASPSNWTSATTSCVSATANDLLYGSCVERLDLASKYTYKKRVLGGTAGDKTNSAQSLHQVR